MKIWNAALACGALALGGVIGAHPAQAQGTQFPDVPANHWAYQAVQDLADKGYVKGYPDGKFLGARDLTRYEFATVIDRMVQTINDLSAKVAAGTAPTTPTGNYVTQDDLNKLQALVDSFHTQLEAIQSQIGTVPSGVTLQDELDSLRQDVLDTKAAAAKAQATADAAYSSNPKSKFNISGYIQARAIAADSGSHSRFPNGANALGGAYNGTYGGGGTADSLEVRRARIKVAGSPTANTKYGIQLDLSGFTTAPTQVTAVTPREAYVTYTAGDGTIKNPSLTAGLFANPFGYVLPASMSVFVTPERPLAFSENGQGGGGSLWAGQDYDKGAEVVYNPKTIRFVYAVVNGTGRNSEATASHFDSIYRVAYQSVDHQVGVGASYYDGEYNRGRPGSNTNLTFQEPKKQIFGLDGQVSLKNGIFVNGEFEKGKYEQRGYFDQSLGTGNPLAIATAQDTFNTDGYVKNNQIQGYYVQGGYTFGTTGTHPLTLAINYDNFQRSINPRADSGNTFSVATPGNSTTSVVGGSTYDDTNLGYGALYNLDKATRLRLWYTHPFAVSHAEGTPTPPRIGLYTAEVQVKF